MAGKSVYWSAVIFIYFFVAGLVCKAQSAQELFFKGMEQDSLTHYYQAVELFSRSLELESAQPMVYYNRGISYMKLRKFGLALVDFNKTILLDTNNTEAYYNRFLANKYTSNLQFAMADISHYVKKYPTDLEAVDARADLAADMRDWDLAISDMMVLVANAPENSEIKMRLAEMYIQNKQYAKAENLYTHMLNENAEDFGIYLSRAYVRYYQEKYAECMDDINVYALRKPGNVEALKLKADVHFYLKNFEEAANLYTVVLRTDSMNAGVLADYGHCLLQQKLFEQAEKILTKSIITNGESPAYAYLGRGIARYNLNKPYEACTDWNKSYMLGEKRAKEYVILHCKQETLLPNR